jgi:two-component system sensor kinase FixL
MLNVERHAPHMVEHHFSDAVVHDILQPITVWLGKSLDTLTVGASLQETAEPLIRALETIPDAGQFAIILAENRIRPIECLAAPSLAPDVIHAVKSEIFRFWADPMERLPSCLPLPDYPSDELRLFPLFIDPEHPTALLITVRATQSPETPERKIVDAFLDEISRLANTVIEDLRLRTSVRNQQELTQTLLKLAPDAIVKIDHTGTILSFNGRAPTLFGYASEEMVGEPLERFMPPETAAHPQSFREAFQNSPMRPLPDFGRRLEAVRKDGSRFPIEVALSEVSLSDGTRFIAIVRDISKRVQREQELAEMRRAIAKAAERNALADLSANLGHELGQPLTAIANYMDALELHIKNSGAEDADALLDLTRKASGQARLGGEIVRKVRRLVKGGTTDAVPGDLQIAVEESAEAFRILAQKQGATLSVQHFGPSHLACFDRVQIYQVVSNLIGNALNAVADQPSKDIQVRSSIDGDEATISVSDNGPGIDDETKEWIFDGYRTTRPGGLGLGLSVVKRIAEAHGGTIRAETNEGGGARFVFSFPVGFSGESKL